MIPEIRAYLTTATCAFGRYFGPAARAGSLRYNTRVSYAAFLAVFLVGPIAVLVVFLRGRLRRFHVGAGALVCALAAGYTTPWDNFAVKRGLWSFAPGFVWGAPFRVGALPLEECLFYVAEAVFVCLAVVALSRVRGLDPVRGAE